MDLEQPGSIGGGLVALGDHLSNLGLLLIGQLRCVHSLQNRSFAQQWLRRARFEFRDRHLQRWKARVYRPPAYGSKPTVFETLQHSVSKFRPEAIFGRH